MEDKVTFSLNGVFGTIRTIFEFLLSFVRPVGQFMREVAGESWLGFALVFAIGFSLMLIRGGIKSKGLGQYGAILEFIGRRGLIACAAVLAVLAVEFMVEPIVTVGVAALTNTLTGGEPGLFHLAGFLSDPSPGRAAFLGDLGTFYGEGHTAFPIGFRAVTLIAVCFGCMFVVGKAAATITLSTKGTP